MIDVKGSDTINWVYQEIYDHAKQDTLDISLEHTRASDGIRIKYDSERDGWVIYQELIIEHGNDGCGESTGDYKEVAFVQSWARVVNNGGNK